MCEVGRGARAGRPRTRWGRRIAPNPRPYVVAASTDPVATASEVTSCVVAVGGEERGRPPLRPPRLEQHVPDGPEPRSRTGPTADEQPELHAGPPFEYCSW